MLRWRMLLGTVFVGLLVLLCWLDSEGAWPGGYLLPLALLLSVAMSQEIVSLAVAAGARPIVWLVYSGNLLVVASNVWPLVHWPCALGTVGPAASVFVLVVLVAFVVSMARFEAGKNAAAASSVVNPIAATLFAVAYVGLLLSSVVQLRLLGGAVFHVPEAGFGTWGLPALASLVATVKMCDTGAYTTGRLFGRHKLAPRLSPGKTIEGACGGLVFACLGAWLTMGWLVPPLNHPLPVSYCIVYGLVVGVAGMLGDLAESIVKRDAGQKDSSRWMPGFGGVLDLMDSILFAAPVSYLAWLVLGPVSAVAE